MQKTRNGMQRVLVVDDDPAARRTFVELLEHAGYEVLAASTTTEARRLAADEEPALAVLDLVLPDGDGLSLLGDLRASWPALPALIVTGYVEPRSIVEAMRRGALDYLAKPFDPDVFLSACRQALARRTNGTVSVKAETLAIVGDSAAMARVRETLTRLARSRPVGLLFAGEDGVGKTFLAQALHAAGTRRGAPCLVYRCAGAYLPSVGLFGPPGGSGGGLLAAAAGGTVVLDDVDRLDADAQGQLLEWAERAAGAAPLLVGLTTNPAAPSRLLAWLRRATIEVAPLRERTVDVSALARHFLTERAAALGKSLRGLTREAEDVLVAHPWPGNVRELHEAIARTAEAMTGGAVQPEHLASVLRAAAPPAWAPTGAPRQLREIEDAYIDHVLALTGGNKTRAAQLLGLGRETLRTRMLARRALS